ncbi:MAG: LemA family protein [Dehalococcoidales bacterium]
MLILILCGLVALGCLVGGFRTLRKKRLVDDLPTSKTRGVFIGISELKGTAESDAPLTSFLAGVRCVYYSWQVEEQWSRVVTTTSTDAKGNTHVSTHTETGWTKVAHGGESMSFYLQDDTGILRIVPEGARINGVTTLSKTCSPGDVLYYGKGPAEQIANSTHKRRFSETALPLHTMLYVMGQARERSDIAAAEIAADKNAAMFLISTRTEKQISAGYLWGIWLWFFFGLCLAVGGAVGSELLKSSGAGLNGQPVIWAVVGFAVALLLGWVWTVYNSLISLRNMVRRGWSQVDIQLKRRFDLIPNLESIVKGYRDYESGTQALLAELRAQAEATPPGVVGADFKGISPLLRVVIEKYPDLKASESFLKLQQALADTEQRIALARDYFNNVATFYNTRLEIVPDRFVAAVARLRPRALMSAADFERAPVIVHLAD